jgi:hypothetical protein
MTLEDLKGKRLYDLNPEEFEEHFCRYCRENEECLRTERDKHYRKLTD